jgi:hypothetical protein
VEVDGLIEEIFRNREEIYSVSKAFLKDGLSIDDYLSELERFRREQYEALDRFYSRVRSLNPIVMAKMVNRVRTDPHLENLYHIAQKVKEKLSERDRRLGEWASKVLMEKLKEAGEPPVPIAPRKAPVVVRVPPAEPKPAAGPEAAVRHKPVTLPPPEAPKAEVPVTPQPQVQAPRREIDRAAIAAAVERAVVKVRKRSPMEVYRDLDGLLTGVLTGPEQQLVFLCRLMMSYLLGTVSYEDLKELSEEYIEQLKSSKNPITKPEVRRLAVEAARLSEEREELRPIASFVQLYLSEAREKVEAKEEVKIYSFDSWLKIYCYPDGYREIEIDGEKAPERAIVQLGDGKRREAPPRFKVRSTTMEVYPIDKLKGRKALRKDSVVLFAKHGYGNKMGREYEDRLMNLLERSKGKLVVVGFLDDDLMNALRRKGIEIVNAHPVIREQAEKGVKRLLGDGADRQLSEALTVLLMLFPKIARAKGRTRSEVAEDASRILRDLLRDADDKGYFFLADVVKVMIEEGRIPGEKIPDRMRRVAETLELRVQKDQHRRAQRTRPRRPSGHNSFS